MFNEISLSDVMFAARNTSSFDATDALSKAFAKHDATNLYSDGDVYVDEDVEQLLSEFGF